MPPILNEHQKAHACVMGAVNDLFVNMPKQIIDAFNINSISVHVHREHGEIVGAIAKARVSMVVGGAFFTNK